MIVLLLFLFIVLIILCYLFFAPFYLEINSSIGVYQIRFHQLARISLNAVNNTFIMEIKVLGWIKKIDLFEKANRSKEERFYKTKSRQTKRIKIVKLEKIWRKIKGTLKSFKVNKCIVSMDTGDMQLNGILYPVFYLASVYTKRNIQINFVEENVIIIEMENSLARMSWAYISS